MASTIISAMCLTLVDTMRIAPNLLLSCHMLVWEKRSEYTQVGCSVEPCAPSQRWPLKIPEDSADRLVSDTGAIVCPCLSSGGAYRGGFRTLWANCFTFLCHEFTSRDLSRQDALCREREGFLPTEMDGKEEIQHIGRERCCISLPEPKRRLIRILVLGVSLVDCPACTQDRG